jgi:para-aminobenzoate synthetase/4-amino-4-deoxychorismate lyase
VIVSGIRTSSEDRFLYHKTTRRQVYEQEFAEALEGGYDDVLFRNEKDEVTEGAVSNVFVETEGKLYTPPVSSGLLPGIYRQHILQQTSGVTEKVLSVDDVLRAGSVFICNAIRGMRRVQVIR